MDYSGKKFWRRMLLCMMVGTLCGQNLFAQSVTTLQRQAQRSLKNKKFADAAAQFERAGRIKNSDPALLYQAGEAYHQVRDYFNASNGYRAAKDDPRFPLAALYYARSLKQLARYPEAQEAFQKAGETYHGDHKEVILHVIENEIAGCELALKLAAEQDTNILGTTLAWLPPPVANPDNAFAPLPFSDTILYFTLARFPQSVLMHSTKRDGAWRSPVAANGLPNAASKDFLCGSFSPDGQRFYFARCDAPPLSSKGSSAETGDCALYVLRRNSSGEWGEPERLRPYINLGGSTNVWPFVCDFGEEEWLFFASDRPGGIGGLDLYTCKRPLASADLDFSLPMNLGNKVNTGADETTPFYDVFNKTLWFSSIGHPGLGGLDIQYSMGEGNHWSTVQNAGIPINSPADDLFFVLKRDGSGAFMASNRAIALEKEKTTDDDLFEVFFAPQD